MLAVAIQPRHPIGDEWGVLQTRRHSPAESLQQSQPTTALWGMQAQDVQDAWAQGRGDALSFHLTDSAKACEVFPRLDLRSWIAYMHGASMRNCCVLPLGLLLRFNFGWEFHELVQSLPASSWEIVFLLGEVGRALTLGQACGGAVRPRGHLQGRLRVRQAGQSDVADLGHRLGVACNLRDGFDRLSAADNATSCRLNNAPATEKLSLMCIEQQDRNKDFLCDHVTLWQFSGNRSEFLGFPAMAI